MSERSFIVKLDPQFDETKKLLVVGGRLQFAQIPEEEKHQIIIPHKDPVIEKLIMHVHVNASHAGPETTLAVLRFWLTQGRREVKQVLNMSHLQALEDSASSTKDGTLNSRESTNSTAIYPHWSRFHWSTVPNLLPQKPTRVSSSVKIPVRSIWSC